MLDPLHTFDHQHAVWWSFDQFSSNFRLQTVAGFRLNRELQCEPFGCVEGSGAECKTCRVQEKRTDDAWRFWRAKGHVGSLWSDMDRTTFWVPNFEVCFDFCSFNVSSDSSTLLVKSQENQCNTCILSSKAVSRHMLGSVRQVQSKTSEFRSQNSGFIMVPL